MKNDSFSNTPLGTASPEKLVVIRRKSVTLSPHETTPTPEAGTDRQQGRNICEPQVGIDPTYFSFLVHAYPGWPETSPQFTLTARPRSTRQPSGVTGCALTTSPVQTATRAIAVQGMINNIRCTHLGNLAGVFESDPTRLTPPASPASHASCKPQTPAPRRTP